MALDPKVGIGSGLYVFRCVATIRLPDLLRVEGEPEMGSTHYLRTYGVTAGSYSEVAEIVSALGGLAPGEKPELECWLDGLEIALMDGRIGRDTTNDIQPDSIRGIHYVSGRIFYHQDDKAN